MFYHRHMQPSDHDRLTVARLSAITQRYAATGAITGQARAEAVAELAAEAAGEPGTRDASESAALLAEHAGTCLGRAETQDGWQAIVTRLRAELAIQAGADVALIAGWQQRGRERAEAARHVPYTGSGTQS
jgi:urease gamma subunit